MTPRARLQAFPIADGSAVADRRGPSGRLTAGVLLAGHVLIGPAAA
jgi:hypothetical protein